MDDEQNRAIDHAEDPTRAETASAFDLARVSRETGFSIEAIETMRRALAAGGGGMAQFAHPEFGGFGQRMRGGMVMTAVRDRDLERRVDRLCERLGGEVPASEIGEPAPGGAPSASAPPALHGATALHDATAPTLPLPSPSPTLPSPTLPLPSPTLPTPLRAGADPLVALEKLAALHVRGVVTDSEFAAKKAELLARV